MATNTAASFSTPTANGTAGPFNIGFTYLAQSEIDVTVDGVLKTLGTHYTFHSATQISFTSGNFPTAGQTIRFQRDTDISAKKVDFEDGSVLTEADLDANSDQVLFGLQEFTDEINTNVVKKDGGLAQITDAAALAALTQPEVQILDGATVSTTELNTLDGVNSTLTASELNTLDGITASTANLNQLTGKEVETSITTNSNAKIPTSKAVNDLVLAVTNALGGFVAIANATSFPTSHPDPSENAGTVVSITNANGIVVNSSGVATISNGAGSSTVTINGFPTDLRSKTLGSGIGLQVQTTTTLHIYDYHKALVKESDLINLSNDIDDFKNRYRVVDTTPTSNNDEGDLIFRKSDNKLLVFNGTIFQEASSIGNFHTNTLSSFNGTGGGSATFNGSAFKFNIDHPPELAEQLLISINNVVQKPNSGTSQPSQGFALDGSTIILSVAPAAGTDFFIITIGKSVNIGNVSDGTITDVKVASDASIEGTKINPNFGSQNIITSGTVDGVDIATRDTLFGALTSSAGVLTDGVTATTQSANDNSTKIATTAYVDGASVSTEQVQDIVGAMFTGNTETNITATYEDSDGTIDLVASNNNSTLAFDSTTKVEATSTGATVTGKVIATDGFEINNNLGNIFFRNTAATELLAYIRVLTGSADRVEILANQNNSEIRLATKANSGNTNLNKIIITADDVRIGRVMVNDNTDVNAIFKHSGGVELYYGVTGQASSKKFETTSTGVDVTGNIQMAGTGLIQIPDRTTGTNELRFGNSSDYRIYHNGTNAVHDNLTGSLFIKSVDDIHFQNRTNNEIMAKFKVDDACELYFDGGTYSTPKLATSATGVAVTGNITLNDNGKIILGTGGETDSFISFDGANLLIKETSATGSLRLTGQNIFLTNPSESDEVYLKCNGGNTARSVELYQGGTKRLETTSTGVDVTGHIDITGELNLTGGGNKYFDVDTLSGTHSLRIRHRNNDGTQFDDAAKFTADGGADLYFNGGSTPKLSTTATGATINGELEIASANGFSTSPSLYVNCSRSTTFIHSGQLLTPNMTAGQQNILVIGKARQTKNAAFIGYKYSSNSSNDNLITFNHWSANELVTINGQGNVVATGDGTFDDLRIGEWSHATNFGGVFHKNQTGQEYMMINNGSASSGHTYISARTNQSVFIRGGNNSSTNQLEVDPTEGINLTAANNVNILDGNIDFGSNADNNPVISMKGDNNRVKYRVFTNSDFGTGFSGNITHGGLNGFCMTFQVSDTANRGWLFLDSGHGLDQGAMALTSEGKMNVAHSLRLGYGESDTTESGATHALDVSGSIASTSTITCTSLTETSDIALKENIQPLSNVLDKVKQLTGYKYNFKDNEKASMGVIAQDVEKVFPELVHGEEGKKGLQYSGLVGALVEAVKELSAKVAALESS